MSAFQQEMGSMLNRQLREVFRMIGYPNPFWLRIAAHLEERIQLRITDPANQKRLANLMKRITTVGLCELLYYHARYKLGQELRSIEFFNEDVILPFIFSGDTIILSTVFVRAPDQDRSEHDRIDLSDARLAQR